MNSRKVDIHSQELNSRPYDCETYALPLDQGHLSLIESKLMKEIPVVNINSLSEKHH